MSTFKSNLRAALRTPASWAWILRSGHLHGAEPRSNSSQSLPAQRKPSSPGMAEAPFGQAKALLALDTELAQQAEKFMGMGHVGPGRLQAGHVDLRYERGGQVMTTRLRMTAP